MGARRFSVESLVMLWGSEIVDYMHCTLHDQPALFLAQPYVKYVGNERVKGN